MDFNDPMAYPELYAEYARGYQGHLQCEGHYDYSRLLARRLLALRGAQ